MFEGLIKYLDSRNLRYTRNGDVFSIIWNGGDRYSYFNQGWSIEILPDWAEDEVLKGEEWIRIRFTFSGIDDDVLFAEKKIEAWQTFESLVFDHISIENKFQNPVLDGSPVMSVQVCISPTEWGADIELDNIFQKMAYAIYAIMSRYEAAYLHWDPEREGGRFSSSALFSFVSSDLPLRDVDPYKYLLSEDRSRRS